LNINTLGSVGYDSYLIKYNVAQQNIQKINTDIIFNERLQETLNTELQNLEKAHELLTRLKQFKMDSKKDFILKTINTALKDIFQKEIRIDIETSSNLDNGKMNIKYDIVLYQNDIEIARNEKLIESNGGGVLSVISILFKMLVGFIYSDNKFYMFDESLSQVSAEFRPRLSKFIKEFCSKQNFTIILVSHTEDLDSYADTIYSLKGSYDKFSVPVLHIDEVLGDYPTTNYIYAKIKNFQSIIDLEFRFKGFTIIRGENNIGKSATLRAINSVIFNNFDKSMQRITKERSIETSIEFGHSDDESKKIRVSFKSQKVNYEFDGMTFSGKNLAFEKVQEKIESIGFKYINLKEMYKNFKGNLKDQTERLSLTTQHDGLFLIGAKNTDSSKVFDFLFDSYQVAGAISKIKIDINTKLNQYNESINIVIALKANLKIEELRSQYFNYKYYINLITSTFEYSNKVNYKKIIETNLINTTKYIDNIIYIFKSIEYVNTINSKILKIKNNPSAIIIEKLNNIISIGTKVILFEKNKINLYKLHYLNTTIHTKFLIVEKLNNIISYGRFIFNINDYIMKYNTLLQFQNFNQVLMTKIGNIDIIIYKIKEALQFIQAKKYIESTNQYISTTNQTILNYNTNIINLNNQILNLNNEFNLQKCPQCLGIGYIHTH
jgi:DNA repair ATPase RecN